MRDWPWILKGLLYVVALTLLVAPVVVAFRPSRFGAAVIGALIGVGISHAYRRLMSKPCEPREWDRRTWGSRRVK